ncbi:hypothetical protein OPQ81_006567 [Rhizoctonia solani]|nr:hypothetical protein OPQ81_006567 [Rhizoctonia solani]
MLPNDDNTSCNLPTTPSSLADLPATTKSISPADHWSILGFRSNRNSIGSFHITLSWMLLIVSPSQVSFTLRLLAFHDHPDILVHQGID